ncbi:MAG: hypothetical protein ACR2IE_01630 [Candidatus Sumerlaeaceae bacterium]
MRIRSLTVDRVMAIVLSVLNCTTGLQAETAAQRGFEESASFAAMLHANKSTGLAKDRTSETVQLSTAALEITRNSSRSFAVELTSAPVIARLHLELWHQGTDEFPNVTVNGKSAGQLVLLWPSLLHRNYVLFLFDEDTGSTQSGVQVDYQGWLPATCMLEGRLFAEGRNDVMIRVGSDQVMLREVSLELLKRLDTFDTLYNFATPKPGKKPPLLWDAFD